MQVVRIHQQGGPEVLRVEEVPTPEPGPGQALVRIAATGVNFVEIYQRTGQYSVQLPWAIGAEGAGTVEAVGPGVADLKPGARVAWAMRPCSGGGCAGGSVAACGVIDVINSGGSRGTEEE